MHYRNVKNQLKDYTMKFKEFETEFNGIKASTSETIFSISKLIRRVEMLKNAILLEDNEDITFNTDKLILIVNQNKDDISEEISSIIK